MYIIDKTYLMHNDEGQSIIEDAMKSGDDIDISKAGINITPDIANELDNYAEQGHRIITDNKLYMSAANSIYNRFRGASNTVYIDKAFDQYNKIIQGSRIEPVTMDCTNAQADVVYVKCIYALLMSCDIEVSMETQYLTRALRTLKKMFPKITLDENTNDFIMFDEYNISYVDSTFLNTIYSSSYNKLDIKDFMYANDIYPAYLVGTNVLHESLIVEKIVKAKQEIRKSFMTTTFKREETLATDILGVKNV